MQTILQVVCSRGKSLREQIVNDARLEDSNLRVVKEKQPGRPHGWAKIASTQGGRGALNMVWDAQSDILLCRVVNKGAGTPHLIVGDFVDYLLARFLHRINAVIIIPG